jgi:hypothetical protein
MILSNRSMSEILPANLFFMQQSHFANAIIQSAVNHNRNHVPTQTAYGTSATYKTDQSSIKVHDTSKTTLEEKIGFNAIGANVFKNEDYSHAPIQAACGKPAAYKTDQSSIKVNDTSKTTLEEKIGFDSIGDHKRSSYSWNWNCDNVAYLNCQQSDYADASAARMVDAPQPVTAPYLTTEDHGKKSASFLYSCLRSRY